MSQRTTVYIGRLLLVVGDLLSWALALALVLYITPSTTYDHFRALVVYGLIAALVQVIGGFFSRTYLGGNKVGSYEDATTVAIVVVIAGILAGIPSELVLEALPRTTVFVAPAVALLLMEMIRWVTRAFLRRQFLNGASASGYRAAERAERAAQAASTASTTADVALVYGAGIVGHHVARLIDQAVPSPYNIVGYLDDAPENRYLRVRRYPVLGRGADLEELVAKHHVDVLILAISHPSTDLIAELSRRCRKAGVNLVVVPPVREMVGGRLTLGQLRAFDPADLLGRRQIETDLSEVSEYLNGKVVLVTGAGGSIGSELAKQVHKLGPRKLVLLDRDETGLHTTQLNIYGKGLLDTDDMVLCDIRDQEALERAFAHHRPDVVFHAAALKHLPMLEQYPDEGWKTNVLGTLNVLQCADRYGVKRLVNISTDKAADPTSILGTTKRTAEELTAHFARRPERRYLSVRFGNVLGSRGSVLFSIRSQIEQGGPVTITHPDITRYFMTIPEACQLVIQAGAIGEPSQVMVLDMGEPVKILSLAERIIAESGALVDITFTGLRPGEKLHEDLFSEHENGAPSSHPLISAVAVPPLDPSGLEQRRHESLHDGKHKEEEPA